MPLLLPDSLALPVVSTDEVVIHRGSSSFVVPATTFSTSGNNAVQMMAKATVLLNDPVPAGALAVSNTFNVASALGLDSPSTVARFQVTFAVPLASNDYIVSGHLRSNTGVAWQNDGSVFWSVVTKGTTGFVVSIRETQGFSQAVSFDFMVTQVPSVSSAPTSSRFVGATTGNPEVLLDNFALQFETATGNLRIRTISGNETVKYWSWGFYSAMTIIPGPYNSNALVVTPAYQLIGDPGALFIAERRFIEFTPSATSDLRAYKFEYLGWDDAAVDKIMMKITGF